MIMKAFIPIYGAKVFVIMADPNHFEVRPRKTARSFAET